MDFSFWRDVIKDKLFTVGKNGALILTKEGVQLLKKK